MVISEIENINTSVKYTPLAVLKTSTMTIIDIIGRIVELRTEERILKDGNVKSILILTIRDTDAHIDVTLWEHTDTITKIPEKELPSTVVALLGATMNHYQEALTINIGTKASVIINPTVNQAKILKAINEDVASLNLSQRSEQYSCSSFKEFTNDKIVQGRY